MLDGAIIERRYKISREHVMDCSMTVFADDVAKQHDLLSILFDRKLPIAEQAIQVTTEANSRLDGIANRVELHQNLSKQAVLFCMGRNGV